MEDKNYKFSIIIPTYNRSKLVQRCLESLSSQTYKNFEVLVCDDGSADDTKRVVDNFSTLLDVRYFYNENWGGPACPRNIGLNHALAEWICFLDSDDWCFVNRLDYISKLDLQNSDVIYHDLQIVKDGHKVGRIRPRKLSASNPYHDLLFNLNAIPTSSVCVRKKLIEEVGGFQLNKKIIGLEDFDLWIRLAAKKARFRYLPIELGCYAMGNDNITFKDDRQILRFNALYQPYMQLSKSKSEFTRINAALNYQTAFVYVQQAQYKQAVKYLRKSFTYGSLTVKLKSTFRIIQILKKAIF
jgi:glycosyltransferase involved in cell wall biosynthesis